MLGRNNIVKVIKKGDLDRLKKILEKDPSIIEQTFEWPGYKPASILHIAASYNQPELVKFLVTEKDMAIDKTYYGWAPLYYAARKGASQAVKTLLDLGASPGIGDDPYQAYNDEATKELLRPYHEERLKQEAAAEEEASEVKIKGTWTPVSSDEIVFDHDLPGHRIHLTETFNFATESRKLITENLLTGQMSPPETKRFDELSDKEVERARAQLEKIRGDAPAKTPLRLRLT